MKYILIFIAFMLGFTGLNAQKVVSGKSQPKTFTFTPSNETNTDVKRGLPPDLYAGLEFIDKNENGVLEADENAILKLTLTNKGKGPAQNLEIKLKDNQDDQSFTYPLSRKVRVVYPGQSITIDIPLKASMAIKSLEHKLEINVLEHFGYDMDPAYLVLNTLEYQKPQLAFAGYEVLDAVEGTYAIKADQQIQPGEQVKLKVFIQNRGQNVAQNITYQIKSTSDNVYIEDGSGTLGELVIGEVRSFLVTVSPNKRVDASKELPIYIDMDLDKNLGGLDNFHMPIAMNKIPPKTEVHTVKADIQKIEKQVARFEVSSEKFTTNVSNLYKIQQVVPSKTQRNNAVAVVIGIENYEELPPAPYAENDAEIMKSYFKERLGIEKVVLYTSEEAKGFIFDDIFNPEYGKLQKAILRGQTDLFVFYSGHGVPSKDGSKVFLFPADGRTARMESQGYNINTFYENLEKIGARSVTVFIDACFSGASRQSASIQQENLVAMKGVRIKPTTAQPWVHNPKFSVFSSSSMDETSLSFDDSQTGLFTYFICAGLQGEADLNNDRKITSGELSRFVKSGVVETSKKISGLQTPIFHGDPDYVLLEY